MWLFSCGLLALSSAQSLCFNYLPLPNSLNDSNMH
jgi:hypothetical protein